MKQDINTILANLAVTIAEKEEDIKRLTERVKEQETVVLRGEDEKDLPKKFVDLTIEYEQLRSEYIEKDAMLSQVSNENNQRRLKIIDLEAEVSALEKKLAEKHKTFDADAITEYFENMEMVCEDCPFSRRCEIAQVGGLCEIMADDSGEYVKLKLKED